MDEEKKDLNQNAEQVQEAVKNAISSAENSKNEEVKQPEEKPQEKEKKQEEVTVEVKQEKGENAYGDIPGIPTQDAVNGIKFDFNSGFRIYFPENNEVKYHLRFVDADSNLVMYDSDVNNGTIITSTKKYYLRYHFDIIRQDNKQIVFEHTMDLKDKDVLVQFPVNTIGDSIGWFSYVERFQKKFGCKVKLVISDFLKELVEKQYPQFDYIKKEDTAKVNSYANYYIGLFFKGDTDFQPIDFRLVGLHRTAGYILGLRTKEELEDIPPRFDLSAKRQIKGKYCVISAKASAQCKFWNNPFGWDGVVHFLKAHDYKVICIDRDRVYGAEQTFNQLPWGVEDYTGNIPLQERINVIKDADFFIGLGSGLSWVAWGCKVPVVLISGFSLPNTEFYTPYRVINYQACIGCWDDVRENFDHSNYFWCPRHQNDNRKYECTRYITAEQVIQVIQSIPTFKPAK